MKTKIKTKLNLITFVAVVVLSLAGVGWWAITNIGIVSNIVHPQNSGISIAASKDVPSEADGNTENSITPTNYKPVHYLFFNGNGSYGLVPANQKLNVRQFSIVFWIKSDGPTHSSFDRPIQMLQWIRTSGGLTIPYGWAFDVGNETKVGIDKLRFTVGNTLGNLYITNPVIVPRNSWTHIMGTFNGKTLELYQNGALVGVFPFRGSYSYHNPPIPIKLAVGWQPHRYWTGDLSDIRIYERPLSSLEISSIFHGQDVSNGLIGWWKLTEGSGNSIGDSSGNGNNGLIHGAIWK
ncbi:MAG: LamG domain-containing protein [Candidatus Nitrosopolaris sp.]